MKISEIADIIDVSEATVRNWQKTNVIPYYITADDMDAVKAKISGRNNKRANKTKNVNCNIPLNYLDNKSNELIVRKICDDLNETCLSLKQKIYLLSLMYLRQKNEIDDELNYRRSSLGKIMEGFAEYIEKEIVVASFKTMRHQLPDDETDVLGVFYQSLKTVGCKSNSGSFYTSAVLANKVIEDDDVTEGSVLDPCCGTGSFLIKLSEHFPFDNIYAFDNDEIAVFIAKVNMLLSFPDIDKTPNVLCLDSLTSAATIPNLRYVCSNPPWGAFKNSGKYLDYKKLTGSSEVFSMFLYKYVNTLDDGGRLSFILPESFLNVSSHSKIRNYICNNFSINRIEFLGRQFTDVFTSVILISIDKIYPAQNHKVRIKTGNDEYEVEQSSYQKNMDCIFDTLSPDSIESKIIGKIYDVDYHLLKDNAKWALGIVTGDNSSHLMKENDGGMEVVYTGKEVGRLKLDAPKFYMKYDRSRFHQSARESMYRADEKLIYKFISSDLTFAYDDTRSLTLNSANILIPEIEGYSVKLVGAILNSSVCNFVFRKRYASLKVLKRHVESLPIVKLSSHQINELEDIIEDYLDDVCDFDAINNYIFDIYDFTAEEREALKRF